MLPTLQHCCLFVCLFRHAMVTQWVETHRQQSSHLTKPEFNLSAVSHSSDPNMPSHGMNAAMPGVQLVPSSSSGSGGRRTMGGASGTSRTSGSSTTGRHRWASVSPGPLNSRFSTLPSASNNAIACNSQLTI